MAKTTVSHEVSHFHGKIFDFVKSLSDQSPSIQAFNSPLVPNVLSRIHPLIESCTARGRNGFFRSTYGTRRRRVPIASRGSEYTVEVNFSSRGSGKNVFRPPYGRNEFFGTVTSFLFVRRLESRLFDDLIT